MKIIIKISVNVAKRKDVFFWGEKDKCEDCLFQTTSKLIGQPNSNIKLVLSNIYLDVQVQKTIDKSTLILP